MKASAFEYTTMKEIPCKSAGLVWNKWTGCSTECMFKNKSFNGIKCDWNQGFIKIMEPAKPEVENDTNEVVIVPGLKEELVSSTPVTIVKEKLITPAPPAVKADSKCKDLSTNVDKAVN